MLALSFWRYQKAYLGEISVKSFYLNLIRYSACACARHTLQLDLAKAIATRKQCGFSLVELVVVIALLSIVALASTSLIIDNGDLKRQLETEARWNQIHDAIISPPNLYLNGSPYVRGYVADMGRLPVSIYELISLNATFDHDGNAATPEIPLNYDHDDNPATAEIALTYDDDGDGGATTAEIQIEQPAWANVALYKKTAATDCDTTPDDCYWLAGGWRGPYLYTAGSHLFRDGWGREDTDTERDLLNFGWEVDTDGEEIAEVVDLFVQSLGSNQEAGGNGDFTEDFPVDAQQAIVAENEWTLSTSPITFNINFSKPIDIATEPKLADDTTPNPLILRVYRYVDNGDATAEYIDVDDTDDDVEVIDATAPFTANEDMSMTTQTIVPTAGLPIGRFAAVIWCTNNTAIKTDDTVYDGDCNNGPTPVVEHSPVYFTLTNNTSQVTLTWDLP